MEEMDNEGNLAPIDRYETKMTFQSRSHGSQKPEYSKFKSRNYDEKSYNRSRRTSNKLHSRSSQGFQGAKSGYQSGKFRADNDEFKKEIAKLVNNYNVGVDGKLKHKLEEVPDHI